MNLRGAAFIVLACIVGCASIAAVCTIAAAPWHPPGEDQAPDFSCTGAGEKHVLICEARHFQPVPFPNQYPRWFAYPLDGRRCDADRGVVVRLYLWQGTFLIEMKPGADPTKWVRKWYEVP